LSCRFLDSSALFYHDLDIPVKTFYYVGERKAPASTGARDATLNRRRKNKPVRVEEARWRTGCVLHSIDDLELTVGGMKDRGFWAAYDNVSHLRRILIESCAAKFVERLRRLHASGQIVGQVYVATAAKEGLLLDPEWEERVESAIQVIRAAKTSGDRKALKRLRSAGESDGLKRGPKVTPESNRWKIETLHALAKGGRLKVSISHPMRKLNSASAELSRYCRGFYVLCHLLGLETQEAWKHGPTGGWSKWPWSKRQFESFGFRFPEDFPAAQEAYKCGRKAAGFSSVSPER